MIYAAAAIGLVLVGMLGWNFAVRAGYESAEYTVVEKDGNIEIREYPDLMLASVDTSVDSQGRDGSFMKLFRYISGANESDQKIAMTTPVFMEDEVAGSNGKMGFVLPKQVAAAGVPNPEASEVHIRKRIGGRFAVIRFAGRLDSRKAEEQEKKLREWMASRELVGEDSAESAGYDPPFTPGPLRRNEVLIRLKDSAASVTTAPSDSP